MQHAFRLFASVSLLLPFHIATGQQPATDATIAEAVSPLPQSLRDGATVVTYDANGNPKVLRQGSNGITCSHDWPVPGAPPFAVRCHSEVLVPEHDKMVKLIASGKSHQQAEAEIEAETEAGTLQLPPPGTMIYFRSGKSASDSKVEWIMLLPNAKAEILGLSTKPSDTSPWMMLSGTPRAHVMLPQTKATLAQGH